MSLLKKSLFLSFVMMIASFSLHGQVDSTFLKGELILEDGFYGADRSKYENPIFFGTTDDSSYNFLEPDVFFGLDKISTVDYRYIEADENPHSLMIKFGQNDHKDWEQFTKGQIGESIVFIIDNAVVSVWGVMGEIPNGWISVGGSEWSKEDILLLQKRLNK